MQQNLSIKVALGATNKMTGPLNAARQASRGLASSIKSTQDNLRALDRQARKFDTARSAVNKSAEAMKAARDQAKAMRLEFGKASERTDEQKARLAALSNEVGRLTRNWKAETANLDQVRASFYRLGVSVRDGTSATEQITARSQQYNAQLSRQQSLLERVTKAQAAFDRTKALSGKLRSAGFKAGAAGGGLLWGSMRLMKPGMEFDQAYSQTLANAQLTRDSAEGRALRDQAKMLARTTHYSAVQATQGQSALIAGGMTATNARRALPGVLNMALASHTDLGQAADIGSNVLDHFQLDAGQMGRVADVMTATFTRSKTSLSSLNETMEYVGTIANNAGVSLETTAAAAAMLAKNGLQGSIAGTGLKEALSGLYSPSSSGAKALKALHVTTVTATGAVRPLADLMQELWNKTRKFDQGSQFSIFQSIFGKEGMTAAQVLARSAAEGNLQSFQQYLQKVQGLSARTANTMTDNFSGDMQMLHSAWDGLWTQMEEGADAPMRKVVQWLTRTIQSVTTWANAHPQLTSAIADTALALGALLAVGGSLLVTLAGILGPLAAVRLSFSLLAGAEGVGGLSAAFGGLGTIAESALGGIAAAVAGITLPVWGVIALIAAAAVAVIHWWEPIKAFFSGLFGGILDAATPVIEAIRREWSDFGAIFSWLWDKVTNFMTPVHDTKAALDKCASAGRSFGELIGRGINMALTPLKKLIDGLDWVLRKAGIVPDVVQYAQDKADALRKNLPPPKKPMVAVWDPATKKMTLRPWDWSAESDKPSLNVPETGIKPPATGGGPKPEFGTEHWAGGGKKTKQESAGTSVSNTGRLGDIVFKNLPAWVPLTGGFAQPRIVGASGSRLSPTPAKSSTAIGTNVAGDINLHFHIDGSQNMSSHQLAREVQHQVMDALSKINRQKLASLKDRE
ncbi:phage tail tape measure protein [Enterobacter asburiae]